MKLVLALLASLFLLGCDRPDRVHYCKFLERDTVIVTPPGTFFGHKATVHRVTTDREGCWYLVVFVDSHIRPEAVLIHEKHVEKY